jgi:acetylglutamate kinase
LPQLKTMSGSYVVLHLGGFESNFPELLARIAKECVTMKSMGVNVVVVFDCKIEIDSLGETSEIKKMMLQDHFATDNGGDSISFIESGVKTAFAKVFASFITQSNGLPLIFSGRDGGIVFDDEFFNGKQAMDYDLNIPHFSLAKNFKKFNVDILHEFVDTNIIPLIIPTFSDVIGNEYICDGRLFAATIGEYVQANRLIMQTCEDLSDLNNSVIGASQFTRKLSSLKLSDDTRSQIDYCLDSIKAGVAYVHMINLAQSSIIEEVCSHASKGLLIYDDISSQI